MRYLQIYQYENAKSWYCKFYCGKHPLANKSLMYDKTLGKLTNQKDAIRKQKKSGEVLTLLNKK